MQGSAGDRIFRLSHGPSLPANVSADKNPFYSTTPGEATQDQVFLLSIVEVNKYFRSDSLLTYLPTEYTLAQGAWADDETSTCWWWLRSPGNYYNCAAGIDWDGAIDSKGVSVTYSRGSIRPAIWINAGS